MYVIYIATNKINGKSYIGFTQNLKQRQYTHKCKAKYNKENNYFHASIHKYGWNNFEWKILYKSNDKDFTLNIMEPYLIKTFNTMNEGYNTKDGGQSVPWTDEIKKKLSNKAKQRPLTEERLQILEKMRNIMKINGHTEETKRKISEAHKGKPKSKEHKINIGLSKKGASFYTTEEYRQNMSLATKGIKKTEETKQKMKKPKTAAHVEAIRMAKAKKKSLKILEGF